MRMRAIRHSVDTRDAFYEEEQSFFDDALPVYEKEIQAYYRVLTNHELRSELEAEWGIPATLLVKPYALRAA